MVASLIMYLFVLVFCLARSASVIAQTQSFTDGLTAYLDEAGLTNFSSILKGLSQDADQQTLFHSIADSSSPKTFFVPMDSAFLVPNSNAEWYTYNPNDNQFLSALVSYHFVQGTWRADNIGTNNNWTIAPTLLQGHEMSYLEGDIPQMIVCGSTPNGFEIIGQRNTTSVTMSGSYGHITIHALDNIIGIPSSFGFLVQYYSLSSFAAIQSTSSRDWSYESVRGMTVFAPINQAFTAVAAQVASTPPQVLFNNHLILGHSVWSTDFTLGSYSSISGHPLVFTRNSDNSYNVTLNGVTARIIQSDILAVNGVMHLIDQVFINVTSPTSTEPPSTGPPITSSATETSTWMSSNAPYPTESGHTTSASTATSDNNISSALIIGIVASAIVFILGPIAVFIYWRVRCKRRGTSPYNSRLKKRPLTLGLPSPVLKTTPFTTMYSHPGVIVIDSPTPMTKSDHWTSTSSSSSAGTSRTQDSSWPRGYSEKSRQLSLDALDTTAMLPRVMDPAASIPGEQRQRGGYVSVSEEVFDRVWQKFSERMGRSATAPTTGERGPPPTYSQRFTRMNP